MRLSPFVAKLPAAVVVALLLAAAPLLAAPAPAGEDRTVVLWAMGSEAEVADKVLGGFRALHPETPVRVQKVPWSAAHEKLLTAYVGGSMPDVFQLGNTWLPEFETLGALEPLDSRVAASSDVVRGDFFAGALEPNLIGGRLVALPWYVDTRLLFYHRALLEKAGVTAPPCNWEEWKSAMRRVHGDGGTAMAYGVFLPVDEWQTPVILALQQGAPLLRDGDRYGNFRSPEFRRAMEFYTGLFRDGLAPTRSQAQVANLYREFQAGFFAYFVTGPWNLGEMTRRLPPEMASKWTTAPMPAPDGEGPGASIAGGASLAVSSASPRKDDAWRVVEYLASPAAQNELRQATGDLPSRRSAWDAAGVPVDEKAAAFRVQLDHLVATPKVPEWERIASKITLHLERVVRGEETLDASLTALDADVDDILAKRRSLLAAEQAPQ